MLETKNLSFNYGDNRILDKVNIIAYPGEITAFIGCNGTGKSTLFKSIMGYLKSKGEVIINGKNRKDYCREELTKKISYLAQFNQNEVEITVFEVILLGRINNLEFKVPQSEIDKVWEVLKMLKIEQFAGRKINELSGGQRQLVYIAQSIVREPNILMLDEPTNNLDLRFQFEMMQLIKELTVQKKLTTLIILHQINLVTVFCDRVVILNEGKVYAQGPPSELINEKMFKDVYKMEVDIQNGNKGYCSFIPVAVSN